MTAPGLPPEEPGGPPPGWTAPDPEDSPAAVQLEYAQSEASAQTRITEWALSAGLTCSVVLGSAIGGLLTGAAGAIAIPLGVVVLLAIAATALRKKPRCRALAAGILAGIGIALLLDGLCWLVISNSRIGG